jgi:hypothetical protein
MLGHSEAKLRARPRRALTATTMDTPPTENSKFEFTHRIARCEHLALNFALARDLPRISRCQLSTLRRQLLSEHCAATRRRICAVRGSIVIGPILPARLQRDAEGYAGKGGLSDHPSHSRNGDCARRQSFTSADCPAPRLSGGQRSMKKITTPVTDTYSQIGKNTRLSRRWRANERVNAK